MILAILRQQCGSWEIRVHSSFSYVFTFWLTKFRILLIKSCGATLYCRYAAAWSFPSNRRTAIILTVSVRTSTLSLYSPCETDWEQPIRGGQSWAAADRTLNSDWLMSPGPASVPEASTGISIVKLSYGNFDCSCDRNAPFFVYRTETSGFFCFYFVYTMSRAVQLKSPSNVSKYTV